MEDIRALIEELQSVEKYI